MASKKSEEERLVEQFLQLKPSRAIDRLISEHSVERAYQVHSLLQDKIKRNTAELRTTLTNKYENLVDCSTLLSSIKDFTLQIAAIEQDISRVYRAPVSSKQLEADSGRGVVSVVEELLYKKQYSEAMRRSHRAEKADQKDIDYLPYLRIQILEGLETELLSKQFTKKFIQELIYCLSAYIEGLSPYQRQEVIKNQRVQGQLLSILADTLETRGEQGVSHNDIIEVIFKCKLLSLHRGRDQHQQQHIYKFFHDIYSLVHEREGDQEELRHLADIFCRNLHEIEHHLSETFIVGGGENGALSFRYQTYQHLLSSADFIDILDKLYAIIAEHHPSPPSVTLKDSFINLWQNYYVELIGLLFQTCNPVASLPPSHQAKAQLPGQIQRYCVEDRPTLQILASYNSYLDTFTANMSELITKANSFQGSSLRSSGILDQISRLYSRKVDELNALVDEKCQQLAAAHSLQSLSDLVLLFMLCGQFNHSISQFRDDSDLAILKQYRVVWKEEYVSGLAVAFGRSNSKWNIEFDKFFIAHFSPTLNTPNQQLLKRIAVLLVEALMLHSDPQRGAEYLQKWNEQQAEKEKAELDRKNRIKEIPVDKLGPSTFAKKKNRLEEK